MGNIPKELHYTKTHEWVKKEDDGTYKVGITDHAQSMLGDIVFVDLPKVDTALKAEVECCTIESVKAASDIYAPVAGTIVEVNSQLEGSPNLVNNDPYGDGWLFRIKPSKAGDIDKLLTAADYKKVEEE